MASTSAYEVNYETIVESKKGAEAIEHKNTIAVQFHVDKHYESTIQLLNNFINHHILLIQEMGKTHMMIDDAENLMKTMMYTKGPNSSTNRKSKISQKYTKIENIN